MLERGRRSAVGVHGFLAGGLIVEAGKMPGDVLAPLVARIALPREWRFVLVTPQQTKGIAGDAERRAFETLPPVPATTTERLCQEILLGLIPAATAGDLPAFGESLSRYNRSAGECFATAQGGAFSGGVVEQLVEKIRGMGVAGVGQSSWGPTVFALTANEEQAESLVESLCGAAECRGADIVIAAPNVGGATIEFV